MAAVMLGLNLTPAHAADPRYLIIDTNTSGPGGSDMNAVLALLQSPEATVLGITVLTGDNWRDVEVAHALRLLEIIGRTDVGVHPGAAFPLVRTKESTVLSGKLSGRITFMGAWNDRVRQKWNEVPALEEGMPTTKASEEGAVQFLVRIVHQHPHQVTIFAGGPLTNIALAVRTDPEFSSLVKQLVVMGGSLDPQTAAAEFATRPRHEFNFWFDPEATAIVLREPWPAFELTTVDVSLQTSINGVLKRLAGSSAVAAHYVTRYAHNNNSKGIAWEELTALAWLDPAIVQATKEVYLDVNLEHGANYGDVLMYSDRDKPELPLPKIRIQTRVNAALLEDELVSLFTARTPGVRR